MWKSPFLYVLDSQTVLCETFTMHPTLVVGYYISSCHGSNVVPYVTDRYVTMFPLQCQLRSATPFHHNDLFLSMAAILPLTLLHPKPH
jgi:hypothetical protein